MRRPHFAAALAAALWADGTANAGPQYLDTTGFAASGYDVVAYRTLAQAPPGQPQPPAVAGHADFTATHNGATFAFASAGNRDLFLVDPARFAPQYDGHCAYGVARGGKVPGNPHLWRIVDDRLYLNITADVVATWEGDIAGYLRRSEDRWPRLERRAPSGDAVPQFMSTAPAGSRPPG